MNFTDRKPFTVTTETVTAFTRHGKRFNCKLCGCKFHPGMVVRWIYANFKESPVRCGNFFVCSGCDGTDDEVLKQAAESYATAVRLAKQWDIYGPEWQEACKPYMR